MIILSPARKSGKPSLSMALGRREISGLARSRSASVRRGMSSGLRSLSSWHAVCASIMI